MQDVEPDLPPIMSETKGMRSTSRFCKALKEYLDSK
jgi:hypothetical protein